MKTASIRDLRNNFTAVAAWIDTGETVRITRRGKPFAILKPARMEKSHTAAHPVMQIAERRAAVYGDRVVGGKSMDDILDADRGQY
jgi:antitoxin (DNA-binding transcriptional repressor) of toxin-antitoxin stability system